MKNYNGWSNWETNNFVKHYGEVLEDAACMDPHHFEMFIRTMLRDAMTLSPGTLEADLLANSLGRVNVGEIIESFKGVTPCD